MTNWDKLTYPYFYDRLIELFNDVKELKKKDPDNYQNHKKTKMFACVLNCIRIDVPTDPAHHKFQITTLGKKYMHWKRVKQGLPRRYRIFFQYKSSEKIIIYAWMNDEYTIRRAGDRKDVYRAFKKILRNKTIPNQYEELKAKSKGLPSLS